METANSMGVSWARWPPATPRSSPASGQWSGRPAAMLTWPLSVMRSTMLLSRTYRELSMGLTARSVGHSRITWEASREREQHAKQLCHFAVKTLGTANNYINEEWFSSKGRQCSPVPATTSALACSSLVPILRELVSDTYSWPLTGSVARGVGEATSEACLERQLCKGRPFDWQGAEPRNDFVRIR
ncbi:hypothetical protein EYF80_018957 [Liparis tanakae]|uniref:Uncharacterized protein n=1 Tax=Liparis tanakae TaxID=230148 RepID=A0A4Z2I0R6_9TELE|nr:hypothetical protein EYF80_018957 [Liparis tanakae]